MKRKARAYSFSVVPGSRLDAALAGEMAALFSSSYGIWSLKSPVRPGEPIRLAAAYYLKNCKGRDYRVALCREGSRLVAQAVYVERETPRGLCALVVQLLVAPDCRRQGIATSLLHAAWGFSDYCAWGIVTSSPCTVEALEAATFRNCRAAKIARESTFLSKEVLPAVPFLRAVEWQSTRGASCVDTKFFTDRRAKSVARRRVEARLGRLDEGWEWLAFTFRDQPLDDLDGYARLIARSGSFVAEAYRRMPQSRQKWAAKTREEISRILAELPHVDKKMPICDFGAGSGRHLAELRRRGFSNVSGIDFAVTADGARNGVVEADCRSWPPSRRFDLILCLYDVVGSFAGETANRAILKNVARHLSKNGIAAISVANFGYAGCGKIPRIDASDKARFVRAIFSLTPADTMAKSGEFFDRATARVDPKTHLFYHKERFARGAGLPGEYLVVDRRYTADEIKRESSACGLEVVRCEFVRAGFVPRTVADGKEILILAKKVSTSEAISKPLDDNRSARDSRAHGGTVCARESRALRSFEIGSSGRKTK